jgi:hypothetical protein
MTEGAKSSRMWCYFRRLIFTPMRDLLRGRITGRFDFYGQLQEVFPEPLARHLLKIVRRTQLDRREQALVTKELMRRFGDRIHGRRSWDTVQTRLGIRRTARSIRRRYKRQRHWARRIHDKTLVAIACSPLAFIVLYICAMVFFWFSKPTISVDNLTQLNEPTLAVPKEDWGWPLYRKAALGFDIHGDITGNMIYYGRTPTHPLWEDMVLFLQDHTQELALIEGAARKRAFGLLLEYDGYYQGNDAMALNGPSLDDPTLPDIPNGYEWGDAGRNLYFHGRVYGFLCIRSLTELTSSDAYLAIEQGDADRFCDRMETLVRIAEHQAQLRCLPGAERANGCRYTAYVTLADALVSRSKVLEDGHLERLRVLLEGQAGKALVDTEGIRLIMMDLIQNAYTRDSLVGGWMTPEGAWLFHDRHHDAPPPHISTYQRLKYTAFTPIVACLMPSRRSMVDQMETHLKRFDEELAIPLHELPDEPRGIENFCGVLPFWHYMSLDTLMYYTGIRRMVTVNDSMRVGSLFGVEVEQYRRQHGEWPNRLEDLPGAAIYIDPITGAPAQYLVRNGQPVLYSVGSDRDNDAGRLPLYPYGDELEEDVNWAQRWNDDDPADGDWVLYPWPDTPLVYGRTVTLPSEDDGLHEGYGNLGMSGYGEVMTETGVEGDAPAP